MKKLIFTLTILISILLVNAQTQEVYCQIVGTKKILSNNVVVQVDFGQGVKMSNWKESFLRNEYGSKLTFNSMIDALNYMSNEDWIFVDAYAITVSNQNVYHYVLKTEVEVFVEEE